MAFLMHLLSGSHQGCIAICDSRSTPTAISGTPLFDPAIANLWRTEDNVLTILDNGFYDDDRLEPGDNNTIFAQNVAEWLATPVHELDTTPPTITSASAYPSVLWPPNHKMVPIKILASADDDTGSQVILTASVTSNEPVDGLGDGDTAPDWTEPVVDQAQGEITLQLRAERSGKGTGREYVVVITATDLSGNSSFVDMKIIVPADQSKK